MNINRLLSIIAFTFLFSDVAAQQEHFEDSAKLYYDQGDLSTAVYFAEKNKDYIISHYSTNDSLLCQANSDLGFYLASLGNYKRADTLFKHALLHAQRAYGKKHREFAAVLDNYAKLKINTTNFSEALLMLKEAVFITQNASDEQTIEVYLVVYSDLGYLYIQTGNFKEAEKIYAEVLKQREKKDGGKNTNYIIALNNLGQINYHMGDYESAEKYFTQALKLLKDTLPPEHHFIATTINNLGILYTTSGNFKKADSLISISLQIKEKVFGRHSDEYALGLNSLARAKVESGNYKYAEPLYLEALSIRKSILGPDHQNYISTLSELGSLYFYMGKDSIAEAYITEAIAKTKQNIGEDNLSYLNLQNDMARLLIATGKYNLASHIFTDNLYREMSLLKNNLDYLTEDELVAYIYSRAYSFYLPLSNLHHFTDSSLAGALFNSRILLKEISLLNKKNIVHEIETSSDSTIKKTWKKFLINKFILNETLSTSITSRIYNSDSLEALCKIIEKELLTKSDAFRSVKNRLDYRWQNVQSKLKVGEAAVEFVNYTKPGRALKLYDTIHYAAMLIRPGDSAPIFVYLGNEYELELAKLSFPYRSKDDKIFHGISIAKKTVKKNIYQVIWRPLEYYLQQTKTGTVYYSADGALHRLAFSAIAINDNKFLLDKYQLIKLSSLRLLAENRLDEKAVPETITIFGGIDYNRQYIDTGIQVLPDPYSYVYQQNRGVNKGSFRYLPYTLKEASGIKNLLISQKKDVVLFTGNKATEANFRKQGGSGSPGVIHFATHGFTLQRFPKKKDITNVYSVSDNPLMRSGIVMAGGNTGWSGKSKSKIDDGILTGMEIAATPLPNTELVVLSACETAGGEIRGSEGVFGLQRAFKLAGVKYVMAALWSVPDKETRLFMNYFYEYWLSGMTIEGAFLKTQKIMRKKYPNPFFWAAFTLVK